MGDASPEVKNDISTRFTIGPTTNKGFWRKERSDMTMDRGPCTLQASLLGIHPLTHLTREESARLYLCNRTSRNRVDQPLCYTECCRRSACDFCRAKLALRARQSSGKVPQGYSIPPAERARSYSFNSMAQGPTFREYFRRTESHHKHHRLAGCLGRPVVFTGSAPAACGLPR